MKKFKTIDLYISIALIIVFIIISLIKRDGTFFIGYFVVGGWQVTSMLIHVIRKWFTQKGSKRYNYHCIVLFTFFLAILFWFSQAAMLVFLFGLLFLAPIMALYYIYLCYKELYVKMVRPLDQ